MPVELAVERRRAGEAAVVEARDVPAADQRVRADAVGRVAERTRRPVRILEHGGDVLGRGRRQRHRVEVRARLADVVEGLDRHPDQLDVRVAGRVLGPRRPLRNADHVEARQQEVAQVPRRDHVGEEEAHDVAPDDVLRPDAEVPAARVEVEVILAPDRGDALVLLDVLQVEVRPHVDRVDVDPRAELPLDAARRSRRGASTASRLTARDQCFGSA